MKPLTNRPSKILVGWKEWCALPELYLPAIKAKIDTGAKTSTLHATHIEPFVIEGRQYVRFMVDPVQEKYRHLTHSRKQCVAQLADRRSIMNSGGHREKRYIIKTPIRLGVFVWEIEITLTDRELLSYRMLIGREALKGRVIVDPARAHCQGRISRLQLKGLYRLPKVGSVDEKKHVKSRTSM